MKLKDILHHIFGYETKDSNCLIFIYGNVGDGEDYIDLTSFWSNDKEKVDKYSDAEFVHIIPPFGEDGGYMTICVVVDC